MIRVLVMIAAAGFVLSVGTLAAAVAIGGPDAIARGGWNLADGGNWNWGWSDHHHRHGRDGGERWAEASGPSSTRNLPWSGAERLDVDLAADVRYIQAPGAGGVEITGPAGALEHVVIDGDSIRYDRRFRHNWGPKLSIVIRAPNINAFDVSGVNSLEIEGYKQARLRLDISGDSEVKVTGETDEVSLDISGSGDADLGELKTKGATVDISGAADATVAPTEWAKIDVTGMGDVRLLTRPARLETDISGAGKVRQGDESYDRSSPSPSASPSPSPSPSPPVVKGAKT